MADGPLLVAEDPMLTIENGPTVIFAVIAGLLLLNIYWGVRKP